MCGYYANAQDGLLVFKHVECQKFMKKYFVELLMKRSGCVIETLQNFV